MTDYRCDICGGPLGFEPRTCCSGRDCGCMGLPIDPPVCSEECWKKFEERRDMYGILHGHSWIKVKRYQEVSRLSDNIDWEAAYNSLAKHHKEETEFLINKCRELAQKIIDGNKNSNAGEAVQAMPESDDVA